MQILALLHAVVELQAHLSILLLPRLVGWLRVGFILLIEAAISKARLGFDAGVIHVEGRRDVNDVVFLMVYVGRSGREKKPMD